MKMKIEYEFVVQSKETLQWYCMICACDLNSEPVIEEHIEGQRHKSALIQYGSDVEKIKGNNCYFCKLCNCMVKGYQNVYLHITGRRHTINFNKIPEPITDSKRLLYTFIIKKPNDSYYCALCDTDLSGHIPAQNHCESSCHAASIKQYGQDVILLKNNYHYACKICNCIFDGYVNIYVHIIGRKHIISMSSKVVEEKNEKIPKKNVAMIQNNVSKSKK